MSLSVHAMVDDRAVYSRWRFSSGAVVAAGRLFMVGLALGFTFSIFEGIALTMGEVGFVPPWFGAWAPFLVYAAIAVP